MAIVINPVNQNDLVKVIESNSKVMDSIFVAIGDLTKTCNLIAKLDTEKVKKGLNNIRSIMPSIKDCINTVNMEISSALKSTLILDLLKNTSEIFDNIHNTLLRISSYKIPKFFGLKLFVIKRNLKKLCDFVIGLKDDFTLAENISNAISGKFLQFVVESFGELQSVIDVVRKFRLPLLWRFKLNIMSKFVKKVINTIENMYTNLTPKIIAKSISGPVVLRQTLKQTRLVLDLVMNFIDFKTLLKLFLFRRKYLRRLRTVTRFINKVIDILTEINGDKVKTSISSVVKINVMLVLFSFIIDTIKSIKFGLFLSSKLKKTIKHSKRIKTIIELLSSIKSQNIKQSITNAKLFMKLFVQLGLVFTNISLQFVSTMISLVTLPLLWLNTKFFGPIVNIINKVKISKNTVKKATLLRNTFALLGLIFIEIALTTPLALMAAVGIWFIQLTLMGVRMVVNAIHRIKVARKTTEKTKRLRDIFLILGITFIAIAAITPLAAVAAIGILVISLALLGVKLAISIINNIRIRKSTVKKMHRLAIIMTMCIYIFAAVILAIPLAVIAAVGIWIVIGALLLVNIAVRILTRIIMRFAKPKVLLGMVAMVTVMGMLFLVALTLILLGELGKEIVENFKYIMGTLGTMILVTIAIGLFAFLLGTVILPAIIPIAVGFTAMILIIGLVTLMAMALNYIAEIKLDRSAIKDNVKTIISLVFDILDVLFNAVVGEPKEAKQPWYKTILNFVGGTFKSIITAVISIAILAAAFVAVAIITMIAGELRLLQSIDLKPMDVKKNVALVLETATSLITDIFTNQPDDKSTECKNAGFVGLLQRIGGALADIATIIMSIAFLALTVVAISIVTFIATQLLLLQNIKLDDKKVTNGVNVVLNTAKLVRNLIFGGENKEETGTRSTFGDFIKKMFSGIADVVETIITIMFLALSLVAIGIVVMIAGELKLLQNIDLDPVVVDNNVTAVIGTAQTVSNSIFNKKDKKRNGSNGLKELILSFFGGFASIINIITSIAFLALSLAAIGIVVMIAEKLNQLQSIKLDADSITKNVESVINTANKIVDLCMTDNSKTLKNKNKSVWRRIAEAILPSGLLKIFDAMAAIGFLQATLTAVGVILDLAKRFKDIDDVGKLDQNMNKPIDVLNVAINIVNTVLTKGYTEKQAKTAAERVTYMTSFLGFVKNLAKSFTEFHRLSMQTISSIQTASLGMFNTMDTLSDNVMPVKEAESTLVSLGQYEIMINGLYKLFDTFEKIKKQKVNVLDVGVIKQTTKAMVEIPSIIEPIYDLSYKEIYSYLDKFRKLLVEVGSTVKKFALIKALSNEKIDKILLSIESIKKTTDLVINITTINTDVLVEKIKMLNIIALSLNELMESYNDIHPIKEKKIDDVILSTEKLLQLPKLLVHPTKSFSSNVTEDSIGKKLNVMEFSVSGMKDLFSLFDFKFIKEKKLIELNELAYILIDLPKILYKELTNISLDVISKNIKIINDSVLGMDEILTNVSKIVLERRGRIIDLLEISGEIVKLPKILYDVSDTKFPTLENLKNRLIIIKTSLEPDLGLQTLNQLFLEIPLIEKRRRESIIDSTEALAKLPGIIDKSAASSSLNGIKDKIKVMHEINAVVKEFGEINPGSSKENLANLEKYSNFLTKVNQLKINNLKEAASLFRQIADLSESLNGNFEGLADALNDKILKAINELNKYLQSLPKIVKDSTSKVSTALSSISSTVNKGAMTVNGMDNVQKYLKELANDVEEIRDSKDNNDRKGNRGYFK